MLYKIRCKSMHPLYGAIPGPYVPVRVTSGTVITHRYTYAPPRISVFLWNTEIFILVFPCQYFCGTILVTPYSMVWNWRVSRAGPMPVY